MSLCGNFPCQASFITCKDTCYTEYIFCQHHGESGYILICKHQIRLGLVAFVKPVGLPVKPLSFNPQVAALSAGCPLEGLIISTALPWIFFSEDEEWSSPVSSRESLTLIICMIIKNSWFYY